MFIVLLLEVCSSYTVMVSVSFLFQVPTGTCKFCPWKQMVHLRQSLISEPLVQLPVTDNNTLKPGHVYLNKLTAESCKFVKYV